MSFFFSSRRRHTSLTCDWSSDVCSSDLGLQDRDRDDLVAEFDQVDAGLWLPFERAYAAKAFDAYAALPAAQRIQRSEERRVGKECRRRGAPDRVEAKNESSEVCKLTVIG